MALDVSNLFLSPFVTFPITLFFVLKVSSSLVVHAVGFCIPFGKLSTMVQLVNCISANLDHCSIIPKVILLTPITIDPLQKNACQEAHKSSIYMATANSV